MEIKLEGSPIVVAKMDLVGFERDMKKSFDLKGSIEKNTTVEKNEVAEELDVIDIFATDINWGVILRHWHSKKIDEMKMIIYNSQIKDLPRLRPHQMRMPSKVATFTHESENVEELFVVHDFVPFFLHHVDSFMGNVCVNYTDSEFGKEFEKVLEFEEGV